MILKPNKTQEIKKEPELKLNTPSEVINILDLNETIWNLFYWNQDKAKLEIFSEQSRIWLNNIINKNPIFKWWFFETWYIDEIIHSPLTDKETIDKRWDLFEYLLNNGNLNDLDEIYSIIQTQINFQELQERNKDNWKLLIKEYFDNTDIKKSY